MSVSALTLDVVGEPTPLDRFQTGDEESHLGAGEFCTVCRAHLDGSQAHPVALKRLKHDLTPRKRAVGIDGLHREIAILSRLRHESVVLLLAHGEDDGIPFCCLDMFSHTLEDMDASEFSLSKGIEMGIQLARALRYCHQEALKGYRVIHRDIKPTNVGVMANGHVVLSDFGLVSLWKRDRRGDKARALTGMTGSLRYMAPEIALSEPYNFKCDVFSFTSLLYLMCSGRTPFEGMECDEYMARVCRGTFRPPLHRTWPASLRALMQLGWADAHTRPDFNAVEELLQLLLS